MTCCGSGTARQGHPSGATASRAFARWQLVNAPLQDLENRPRRDVRDDIVPIDQVRRRRDLKGIGPVMAWLRRREVFGGRKIPNRRALARLVGLDPTSSQSRESQREQGLSPAGNRRVRWALVERAWMGRRYPPESAWSRWYQRRFGSGNARARQLGIVAWAQQLVLTLGKDLASREVPAGAVLVPWEKRLKGRLPAAARPA